MKRLSLKGKLVFSLLVAGLLPLFTVGFYSYHKSSESFEKEAVEKISAIKDIKGNAVKRYFETIRDQLLTFSHDVMIEDAMKSFSKSFSTFNEENETTATDIIAYKSKLKNFYINEYGAKYKKINGKTAPIDSFLNPLGPTELALQYYYIASNSNALGEKEGLDRASDKSNYSKFHKKYHPSVREYLQRFGYYDIFLVDINTGNIVYSVFKELDYATSLTKGPYRNTNFAKAFEKAKGINNKEDYAFVDYQTYAPSFEAPASFIATPIWSGDKKIGVAVFQMPIDRINGIMSQRGGLGKTGETYLVGKDRLLRSDSYSDSKNYSVGASFSNPDLRKLNSDSVTKALKGLNGSAISQNYLGKEVISSYTPLKILGENWALIADIEKEEAFQSLVQMKNIIFAIVGISSILIFLLAFSMASSISKKINEVVKKLLSNASEVENSSDNISKSSIELREAATAQADAIQGSVTSIDEISSMVQRNADSATSSAEVSSKSNEAAERGKKTVESMIKSIDEIAQGNNDIASEMQKNNKEISKIVEVISEIGEKTRVINDIVFQTKLLSFNASVEAARAGEHGKGFAVVAEEVGNLASMSGKAALEITEMLENSIKQVTDIVENAKSKVDSLVSGSKGKVELGTKKAQECGNVLDEILQNVSSVNEMVREIASASSEQSIGVREVTKIMQSLDEATHKNTGVAKETSDMSENLKLNAQDLNDAVSDLMIIVNGNVDTPKEEKNKGSKSTPSKKKKDSSDSNVMTFPTKSSKEETTSSVSEKKVAGSDIDIPSDSDSRFVDF